MNTLEKIYDSTLRFLSPLNLTDTYKNVIEEAINLTGGQYGSIYLESDGQLRRVFTNMPQSIVIDLRKKGYRYKAFKEKKSILIYKDDLKELKSIHPELEEIRARSILIVPLINRNRSVGLLTIDSKKEDKFKKEDLEVLKLFGSLATLAIKKAQLYDEINETLQTRDLFISLASHELRTPLTTINGYVQLLLSKINERKPINNKWIIELAFEGQRMKNLLDEFLEINRIRAGKMNFNFSELSFSEIMNHVISTFKFNFPKRKLIVRNKLPQKDVIIGDSDKLHQVFMNILENSVKYSDPETEIELSFSSGVDFLGVAISDKGQGIIKKDLPLIFKDFYKGEKSKHEGMGLGLYLAKNIIDAHHGDIKIISKIEQGTKILIKLPKI